MVEGLGLGQALGGPTPLSCSQLWVLQSLMRQIVIVAKPQGLGCGFSPGNWARQGHGWE